MRLGFSKKREASMLRWLAVYILALVTFAQSAAAENRNVTLTIYNGDLALIEDVRTISVGKGYRRVEFREVSAQIKPETVTLTGPNLTVLEQNFDFDLLTPGKMMEKAVGTTVTLIRVNPATGREEEEEAEVLSTNNGVVLKIDDHIEVLRDDGLPVRVLFDKIPPNLRARPTLSVKILSEKASVRPLTLRYLSSGLFWIADYVGVFDDKTNKLDLQAWVTLTNQSEVPYADARIKLVAGDMSQWFGVLWNAPRGGVEKANAEKLADYHLYTLPHRTTVEHNQKKQVSILSAQGVKAEKRYELERGEYTTDRYPQNAEVKLAFNTGTQSGLGAVLPAGKVRLYTKDSTGQAQFIGEDSIGHTPQGSDVELEVGKAFDVTVKSEVLSFDKEATPPNDPKLDITTAEVAYTFRNARSVPVKIHFIQKNIELEHEWLAHSLAPTKDTPQAYFWDIPVPANGETVLTFKIREKKERRKKS
jgi:hypothetical protein